VILEALAAAAVSGLGQRPGGLTHGDPLGYAAWLRERVLTADRAFGGAACPQAQIASLGGVRLRSVQIAGEPGRRAAPMVFLEHLRLTGCGRAVTHNLQVTPAAGHDWTGIGVLPGRPRSSPREQTDAMQAVASVIVNGEPRAPCAASAALLSSTNGEAEVIRPPSGARGAWTERWPMRACGADRTVEVTFAPVPGRPAVASVRPAWSQQAAEAPR
jgi:hypothetical protein